MNRISKRLQAIEGRMPLTLGNVYRYIDDPRDPKPIPEHGPDDLVIIWKIASPPKRDPITGAILDPLP